MRSSAVFANYHRRAQDHKNRMWTCQGQMNRISGKCNKVKMSSLVSTWTSLKMTDCDINIAYCLYFFYTTEICKWLCSGFEDIKEVQIYRVSGRHWLDIVGMNTVGANWDGYSPSVLAMSQNLSHCTCKLNICHDPIHCISTTGHTVLASELKIVQNEVENLSRRNRLLTLPRFT